MFFGGHGVHYIAPCTSIVFYLYDCAFVTFILLKATRLDLTFTTTKKQEKFEDQRIERPFRFFKKKRLELICVNESVNPIKNEPGRRPFLLTTTRLSVLRFTVAAAAAVQFTDCCCLRSSQIQCSALHKPRPLPYISRLV